MATSGIPKYPNYPGHFQGISLHSKDYKTPDILRDRRVLIVGAGNSGCDIPVESAQNSSHTFHSMRRGYHFIPKYLLGKPADQVGEISLKLRVPLPIRRMINGFVLQILRGDQQRFGLPKPDHKLFESHPIVNSQIMYYISHGDITPKPDVQELCDHCVLFKDGSEEQIDVIIYATGYNIAFPFIDKKYLNWKNNHPALFMHIFHPQYDNLFVAGLIQPDSGQWGLVDYQTQLIAKFIYVQKHHPAKAEAFHNLKAGKQPNITGGIKYVKSDHHSIEVEHFSYKRWLKKLMKKLR